MFSAQYNSSAGVGRANVSGGTDTLSITQSGQYESSFIVNEFSIFDNKNVLPIFILLSTIFL